MKFRFWQGEWRPLHASFTVNSAAPQNSWIGAGKMVQGIKVTAAKHDNLRSIPRTHKVEEEN